MHSFKKNARHNLGKLYNILRPSEDDNTNVLISSPTPCEDQGRLHLLSHPFDNIAWSLATCQALFQAVW